MVPARILFLHKYFHDNYDDIVFNENDLCATHLNYYYFCIKNSMQACPLVEFRSAFSVFKLNMIRDIIDS